MNKTTKVKWINFIWNVISCCIQNQHYIRSYGVIQTYIMNDNHVHRVNLSKKDKERNKTEIHDIKA